MQGYPRYFGSRWTFLDTAWTFLDSVAYSV
jgi:hypothetical protein